MRRTWTVQEKANIVLEILREESTLAEISRKYDVFQPVLNRWKAGFISNMSSFFDKKGEDVEKIKKEHEKEKEHLINKIGELSMDVNYLKKARTGLTNAEKKALIEFKDSNLTIRHQRELLKLAKSKAYHVLAPVKPSQDEINAKNAIDKIHYMEPSYGVSRA